MSAVEQMTVTVAPAKEGPGAEFFEGFVGAATLTNRAVIFDLAQLTEIELTLDRGAKIFHVSCLSFSL